LNEFENQFLLAQNRCSQFGPQSLAGPAAPWPILPFPLILFSVLDHFSFGLGVAYGPAGLVVPTDVPTHCNPLPYRRLPQVEAATAAALCAAVGCPPVLGG
jgi:hypothetical protein